MSLHWLAAMVLGVLSSFSITARAADAFPTKPVRMIVPFPVAGATDILARVMSQKMSEQMGYQVIVDNRPGAGGTRPALRRGAGTTPCLRRR